MDEVHNDYIDQMETETKFTIIQMNDTEDDKKQQILEDARTDITKLYDDFRDWFEQNINSNEVQDRVDTLKVESADLLYKTKQKLHAIYVRDDIQIGKEKVMHAGHTLKKCIHSRVQDIVENEHIHRTCGYICDKVDDVRHDERVKKTVKKAKRCTLQIAESAYYGLKRALEPNDKEDESQKGLDI